LGDKQSSKEEVTGTITSDEGDKTIRRRRTITTYF
jgi:hypothetical protein